MQKGKTMSRLIRESDVQDMLDDAQCISDGEYSYVCTEDIKLSKLPTVDAIPLSYIYQRTKELKNDGMMYAYTVLNSLVANYRADGERKDGAE